MVMIYLALYWPLMVPYSGQQLSIATFEYGALDISIGFFLIYKQKKYFFRAINKRPFLFSIKSIKPKVSPLLSPSNPSEPLTSYACHFWRDIYPCDWKWHLNLTETHWSDQDRSSCWILSSWLLSSLCWP